ncbi:hypothetical protein BSR29_01020 [Boudabousia liubingyangii]|uniref:THAP4-like heme-binding beta-barrel domain-containing protein n=1 Tax=Boudabousia liubingyangii TaxID=1921764 RepID=A0A1Q5PQ58_9ACTO|nr:hypothetical protein [Boudabousia liubingyangii]OKL49570.1 hypothetical protein BSR29_01020 [Boudabousia liubingyangii]
MLTIDPNLPAPLLPLAWLIDTWEGYRLDLSAETPARLTTKIYAVEDKLRWENTYQTGTSTEEIIPGDSARVGAEKIQAETGTPTVTETLEIAVTQTQPVPENERQAPGEVQSFLEINSLNENGESLREWVGVARGPQIQIQSLGGNQEAEKGVGRIRLIGLVGGELMWSEDRFATRDYTEAVSQGRAMAEDATTSTAIARLTRQEQQEA